MTKHKYNPNETNNQNSTSELNHHSFIGRRSGPLGQVLPTYKRRWNSFSQKPAFTIIEVVLVLAIAGLIFLMVFIALPALQRNQRDTQRKNDMARLKTALDNYKANNRGQIPNNGQYKPNFIPTYLRNNGEQFNDPSGEEYRTSSGATGSDGKPVSAVGYIIPSTTNTHTIVLSAHRKCAADGSFAANPGMNNYAFQIRLENGGVYCLDG